jgi:transcriptional regulator with XRE-family HTH domain
MARKESDQETMLRVGGLLRATRKHLGWSQATVAPHLGLNQATLSKVENGASMINIIQWLSFCQYTGISPGALSTNYIELGRFVSGISLPARYSYDRCETVRSILPLLEYGKKTLGPGGLSAFLREKEIDPDYFFDLNARINVNFITDLVETLVLHSGTRLKDLEAITRTAGQAKNHGSLQHHYNHLTIDRFSLIQSLVENSLTYTSLWGLEILERSKGSIDLVTKQNPAMDRFNFRDHPVLGDVGGVYMRGFLRNFSAYGDYKPLKVDLLERDHRKASRYVFQLSS